MIAVLPEPNLTANVRVRRTKAIRVQGQTSGEIYFLTKRTLTDALDGKPRYASRFVNRKRDHEVIVRWTFGLAVDPQTGMQREGFQISPVVDRSTGQMMRKIEGSDRSFNATEALPEYEKGGFAQEFDDALSGDIKLSIS